jgi:hypothetical protein
MSSQNIQFGGVWKKGNEGIDVKLSLITFEEDGAQIVYCPALDITGYGNTDKEANDSFTISLDEFFTYTTHKKTFSEEMKRLGWKVKHNNKFMRPPNMSTLLEENENFNRIFNNHSFQKVDQEITIPFA